MLVFNPRLLAIIALILGGAYVGMRRGGADDVKEWKVSHAADDVIRKKVLKESGRASEGEAERTRSGGELEFGKARGAVESAAPRRELTAEELVGEVARVSKDTPAYVPTVPLMGRLAQAMLREDPAFITFGDLDPGVRGVFIASSDPRQGPKIVLSNDLKRLHDKGVPIAMIAPVLAHELDHFFYYLTRDLMRAKTHEVETKAMVSTAAYLEIMKRGGPRGYTGSDKKKGDGEAVDAREPDQEVAAYYRFLKKIRASLFGGKVDELVKENYGTDKH